MFRLSICSFDIQAHFSLYPIRFLLWSTSPTWINSLCSDSLFQTCLFSLANTLEWKNMKYFFHLLSHDYTVLCKAGLSGMHNKRARQLRKQHWNSSDPLLCIWSPSQSSRLRCELTYIDGNKAVRAASHGVCRSGCTARLVSERRGDGAASQGRDLSGSQQKVCSIKGEQKFAPVNASQRGTGGGAATVELDWTKKRTLPNKQAGRQVDGLNGLYLDVRSLRTPGDS